MLNDGSPGYISTSPPAFHSETWSPIVMPEILIRGSGDMTFVYGALNMTSPLDVPNAMLSSDILHPELM